MTDKKWIQKATQNKGGLHKALGVSMGKTIPTEMLNKAMHSSNPKMKKMATLAKTLKGMHS